MAAFKDVDVAILVGAMPRKEGMERKDLLKANVKIFKSQGEALDQHAKKSVKVSGPNLDVITYNRKYSLVVRCAEQISR